MTTSHPSHRIASDLLRLWALCGKPACRRAQACKRDARDCLTRYGRLAPEAARSGALALVQGAQDGVGIDEVRRFVPGDIAALEAWSATLGATQNTAIGQVRGTCDHAGTFGG